jgi:hypothetical protein
MALADQPGPEKVAELLGHAPLPPIAGDNAGLDDGAEPMRWTAMLVWFMRTMAVVWIAKGLYNWSVILGADPRVADFTLLPITLEATIIFFAVADLVAAIGLWLASPWGGVLWLVCAICEAASPLIGVKSSFASSIAVAVNAALVAVYLALSWKASSERG